MKTVQTKLRTGLRTYEVDQIPELRLLQGEYCIQCGRHGPRVPLVPDGIAVVAGPGDSETRWRVRACGPCVLARIQDRSGAAWLAGARADSEAVFDGWRTTGIALLPVGAEWDVIVMPVPVGITIGELGPLTRWPHQGPVAADFTGAGDGRVYTLVPPGTAGTWHEPQTRALGPGDWFKATDPRPPSRPRSSRLWITAPDGSGNLTRPDDLRRALRHAHAAQLPWPGTDSYASAGHGRRPRR